MPSSPARIAANLKNSQKSTGPRTLEGKNRSRLNAVKHGLTGEGVALPSEDIAEIAKRFSTIADELRPSTEIGMLLVRRFAFLSVRLERCERHETTVLAERVRHAIENFDDKRMTEVEVHASRIAIDPMTSSRRLQNSPEGLDWLIEHWRELRADLMIEDRNVWTWNHWSRVESFLGNPGGDVRISRVRALTEGVSGFFANLEPTDGAGLDDQARAQWSKTELAAIIDAEIALLVEARQAIDCEAIDRDRLEAPDRALFDASPGMILARKYEAATERAMYKALKEFRAIEAMALENGVTITVETVCEEMASSEQTAVLPETPAEVKGALPRRSMPISLPGTPLAILPADPDVKKAGKRRKLARR